MPRCNLCLKNHALRHCQVFKSFSNDDQRNYVKKWNYCLNCLAHTHARSNCTSAVRCAICSAKHHSMLHRERPHDVTSTSFEEEPDTSLPPKTASPEPTPQEVPALVPRPLVLVPKRNIIPPLIRVNLIHRGNPMWVTFLLHPRLDTSFLKESVANIFPDFSPDIYKGTKGFSVFGVGATYEPRSHYGPIARWKLEIKEADTPVIPPIDDPQLIQHFRDVVPQAHPQFATWREIDGVMGRRSIHAIMSSRAIQEENTPRAQRSIFGWVIFGQWHGCSCH